MHERLDAISNLVSCLKVVPTCLVRDDEKDPMDDLLECAVPVGRAERSLLGTSVTEEVSGVRVVAQFMVELEEHYEAKKPTSTPRKGYSNVSGLPGVTRGGGQLTNSSAGLGPVIDDIWKDGFLEDFAEVTLKEGF